jgi:hypothetical protein
VVENQGDGIAGCGASFDLSIGTAKPTGPLDHSGAPISERRRHKSHLSDASPRDRADNPGDSADNPAGRPAPDGPITLLASCLARRAIAVRILNWVTRRLLGRRQSS